MRYKIFWLTVLSLTTLHVGSPSEYFPNRSRAAQETKRVTVPAGTRILVRTVGSIDTGKQGAGHLFSATLETDLRAEDAVVAPRGTMVHGRVTRAKTAGRMAGESELRLELTDIVIDGTANPLSTMSYELRSSGKGEQTAGKIGGGAGLGALIGGIAGGGRGAGIGAVAGAAGGTAASAATGGEQISIPSESLVEFRLAQGVSLPVAK